jgi:hypothetical protein
MANIAAVLALRAELDTLRARIDDFENTLVSHCLVDPDIGACLADIEQALELLAASARAMM